MTQRDRVEETLSIRFPRQKRRRRLVILQACPSPCGVCGSISSSFFQAAVGTFPVLPGFMDRGERAQRGGNHAAGAATSARYLQRWRPWLLAVAAKTRPGALVIRLRQGRIERDRVGGNPGSPPRLASPCGISRAPRSLISSVTTGEPASISRCMICCSSGAATLEAPARPSTHRAADRAPQHARQVSAPPPGWWRSAAGKASVACRMLTPPNPPTQAHRPKEARPGLCPGTPPRGAAPWIPAKGEPLKPAR